MKNEIKQIEGDDFRKMQLLELDCIVEFDKVCRANNIKYCICGGTMLGAVRHKGYIPWDDDADLILLREDYEKFKKVANQMNPEICFFQDHETDPAYKWGYGKLRRTNTKYIRCGQSHVNSKNGVFVDVFPMDDIPLTVIGMIWQDFYLWTLRKVSYSEVGMVSEKKLFWRLFYKLLNKIDYEKIYKKLMKEASKSSNSTPNRVRCLSYPSQGKNNPKNSLRERYGKPKDWYLNLSEYEFEGFKFWGTADYDSILRYDYGDDYMVPPSAAGKACHSPCEEYDFSQVEPYYKK